MRIEYDNTKLFVIDGTTTYQLILERGDAFVRDDGTYVFFDYSKDGKRAIFANSESKENKEIEIKEIYNFIKDSDWYDKYFTFELMIKK